MGVAMLPKLCFTLADQPAVAQLGEMPLEVLVLILMFLPLDARLHAREHTHADQSFRVSVTRKRSSLVP